mmetsp:Transcript_71967/g.190965  ORF Transcript_71967/g.190965 Transcript_71967/m.190965 type:complete len:308 (-) Transcript_71967:222-1145(-)
MRGERSSMDGSLDTASSLTSAMPKSREIPTSLTSSDGSRSLSGDEGLGVACSRLMSDRRGLGNGASVDEEGACCGSACSSSLWPAWPEPLWAGEEPDASPCSGWGGRVDGGVLSATSEPLLPSCGSAEQPAWPAEFHLRELATDSTSSRGDALGAPSPGGWALGSSSLRDTVGSDGDLALESTQAPSSPSLKDDLVSGVAASAGPRILGLGSGLLIALEDGLPSGVRVAATAVVAAGDVAESLFGVSSGFLVGATAVVEDLRGVSTISSAAMQLPSSAAVPSSNAGRGGAGRTATGSGITEGDKVGW